MNNEKELTMNFGRDIIVGRNMFGDALSFMDGYGKEGFINTYIWLTKNIKIHMHTYTLR